MEPLSGSPEGWTFNLCVEDRYARNDDVRDESGDHEHDKRARNLPQASPTGLHGARTRSRVVSSFRWGALGLTSRLSGDMG